jgi:thiamine biosynthesis lipoprotein
VKVDPKTSTIELPEGMRLGLGGIAQGYGADRAMAVLMAQGVKHAIVNVSGDLKVLGTKFGKPWEIAIVHPRDKERVIAIVPLSNTCLITSGDYERCFEIEGKLYHHILDPRTGRPSDGCMSATVIAPDSAVADSLATGMCVMGWEKGLALIERLPRVEALLVDMNGVVHASTGLLTHVR